MAADATRAGDGGFVERTRASAERVLIGHGGLGASLALVLGGELVVAEGIGWRNPPRTAPVRPEDGFHLYSVAKGFVAAAAVRLAERGALALADYRVQDGVMILPHVEAAPALRGTGAAGRLMHGVLDAARQRGLKVVPLCPYADAFIRRNPEYADLKA